jgi:hypothetical protein
VNAQTKIEAGGVHRKLSRARQKFHTLELKKSGKNTFAGYEYFELGDFLIPALQVFDEIGLGSTISFTADLATMTIRDLDNPEDAIELTSPMGSAALKGCHEVQNIGAVETYQRRYLWVAALEIVEHDALDATNGKIAPETNGKVNDKQFRELQKAVDRTGADLARFCAYFQVPSLKDVPAERYAEALQALEAKAKRAAPKTEPEMAK